MDHRQKRRQPAKAATEIDHPNLTTVASDTSTLEGISVLERAVAKNGNKIDALFLNAGIAAFGPIRQATEADFDAQFNTNVKGHFQYQVVAGGLPEVV